ncbi:hypothetical protein FPRO06_08907 [Fusarium proliferatum]|nr:hypothetical protein FPRO06_08907 [Fusarium proliferatum]
MGIFSPVKVTGMPGYQRHWLIMALFFGTSSLVQWSNYTMFKKDGITFLEGTILLCSFICTFQPIVGSWNAVIGLLVMAFGNAEKSVYPYFDAKEPLPELRSRTALVIFMRNEDPTSIFDRVLEMHKSLSQIGRLQHFRFVLLSDTTLPEVMCLEDEGFARLKDHISIGTYQTPFYRRRSKNIGYKGGNMYDYAENHSKGDEFFVPLDSDSVMSGDVLVRIVSSMEKFPQIGILQTALTGTPAVSVFARLMQFGSRYYLPVNCLGLSWWANECALFWGHNAIVRTRAFREHCKLPVLPGKPPGGGHIMSHDIVEAMFMHRAGYECRLLPITTESYETFPPTLIEAMNRHNRWSQGDMQYVFLLKEPGLSLINRFQVCRILAKCLSPMAWFIMTLAFNIRLRVGNPGASGAGVTVLSQWLFFKLLPKTAALFTVMATPFEIKRYGGILRFVTSVVLEYLITSIVSTAVTVSTTWFLCGLLRGISIKWDAQNRDRLGLSWRHTFRVFWVENLIGLGVIWLMITQDTSHRLLSLIISLFFLVPVTVLTASPRLSCLITRLRLFTTPDENPVSPVLSRLVAPGITTIYKDKAKTMGKAL